MDGSRKRKLIFRWSLFISVCIGMFWAVYYLLNGTMPTAYLGEDPSYQIPRWIDVLIGPIGATWMFLCFFKTKSETFKEYFRFSMVVGVVCFFIAGLIGGLPLGLAIGLGMWVGQFSYIFACELLGFTSKFISSFAVWGSLEHWLRAK